MDEKLYLCRHCRHEFRAEARAGVYSCPRCGSLDTSGYDPSSIFSMLAAKFSGGGG